MSVELVNEYTEKRSVAKKVDFPVGVSASHLYSLVHVPHRTHCIYLFYLSPFNKAYQMLIHMCFHMTPLIQLSFPQLLLVKSTAVCLVKSRSEHQWFDSRREKGTLLGGGGGAHSLVTKSPHPSGLIRDSIFNFPY